MRDIAERLPADNAALRVALARLLEEHLLTERGGSLRGLHELRSRYLMRATHRVPPPVLEDTVRDVIDFAGAAGLQPLLVRILRERTVSDDVAIDAIAQRVARDHEPVALAASLHALRLATLERMADRWRMVFAAERVPVSAAGAVALLFKTRTESSGLVREPIRRAVQRMRAIESPDLRRDLIELAGDSTSLALTDATSIGVAATVLAALGEVGSEVAIDPDQLARLADQAPLPDVRLLLDLLTQPRRGSPPTLLGRSEDLTPCCAGSRLSGPGFGMQVSASTTTATSSHVRTTSTSRIRISLIHMRRSSTSHGTLPRSFQQLTRLSVPH